MATYKSEFSGKEIDNRLKNSTVVVSNEAPTDEFANLWLDMSADDEFNAMGGAYVGTIEPENPEINLWIDPEDESMNVLDIKQGGTGADNAEDARKNLGIAYSNPQSA